MGFGDIRGSMPVTAGVSGSRVVVVAECLAIRYAQSQHYLQIRIRTYG